MGRKFRTAEFFSGIGLVRLALEKAGFDVVFANDIKPTKAALYAANFQSSHFILDDVRNIRGRDVPPVDLATASFPCTDLSLAGNRAGLSGPQSGMFWEFARVIEEMGHRQPAAIMLENVVGFATSRGGADVRAAIERLNGLGYCCDMLTVDARRFVPQSRPRLFIVGSRVERKHGPRQRTSCLRPEWIRAFTAANPHLDMQEFPLRAPRQTLSTLADCVERIPASSPRWWEPERLARFTDSLSALQLERLDSLRKGRKMRWATAFRRTREGRPVWEIRADDVSGCLRTANGGSSKQAIVEAGHGRARARWMMAPEYARLQGAPDFHFGGVPENEVLTGFGDAVCVPVIEWLARSYLRPLLENSRHAFI